MKVLPVVSMVHSGGRSLHGIVRIDAENFEDYKETVIKIFKHLEAFQLDSACKNINRHSSLPGHIQG